MKQKTNNSKDTLNKKAEANARRKVNKSWEKVEHTPRYRSASATNVCDTITKKIEIEVLNGILLNLSIKSQAKPASTYSREASGTGKSQETQTYRRPLINTHLHNQHEPLHESDS